MHNKTLHVDMQFVEKLEELDKENLDLRNQLIRTEMWLHQEREEREKLNVVFKNAIMQVRSANPADKVSDCGVSNGCAQLREWVGSTALRSR